MSITSNYVKFLWGTPESYKNLQTKKADTLYFIAEADSKTGELYWGERLIASAVKSLNDLENVIVDNISNDCVLAYDEAQSAWVCRSVADIVGIMVGATANEFGSNGLVPAPGIGEQNYFLRGDGVWALPEIGATLSADGKSIVVENEVISLNDFGKRYYKYVAASGDIAAHYVEQIVNSDYPWKSGLEPKVVSRNDDLVLGWFEPNPITIDSVTSEINSVQNSISNLEEIIGTPAEDGKPATGLYAKADADKVYTKEETEEKIAEAVVAAAHLKRKTFDTLEEAEAFAKNEAHPEEYIFMVKISDAVNDKYDEYLWVDGALEKVGAWEVDLTDYATKEDLNKKVDKVEGFELISHINNVKLDSIQANAEKNIINSVDEIEFNVIDRHLSINNISVAKVKNLESILNSKADKTELDTINVEVKKISSKVNNIEEFLNSDYFVSRNEFDTEISAIKEAVTWRQL